MATDVGLFFRNAPYFERPIDTGRDNGYEVLIKATDGAGNVSEQAVTVEVLDLLEPVPMYRADLRSGDRLLTTDAAKASATASVNGSSSGVEFWVSPKAAPGWVPLAAWVNLLTGDLFYAPVGTNLPYACYVPVDAGPLGFVPKAGQGSFDLHLWMNAQGVTQIVSRGTADTMGLAGKGYSDLGVLFGSAAKIDGTPVVELVGAPSPVGG